MYSSTSSDRPITQTMGDLGIVKGFRVLTYRTPIWLPLRQTHLCNTLVMVARKAPGRRLEIDLISASVFGRRH